MIKTIKNIALTAFVMGSSAAFAQQQKNVAETADYVRGQVDSFVELALSVGILIGVVLFVFGLYMLYKDSQQPGQGHAKKGFIGLAVGSALLIVPALTEIGSSSIVEGETNSEFQLPG